MELIERLSSAPPARCYVVAYSGGLDSTVLLHLARATGLPGLSAVHVHHGLQAAADGWASHCEAQCRDWHLPIEILRVRVDARHRQGPEAAARAARYAALRGHLPEDAVLMTAHHAGDQAETVLLRLLRGTGIEGLAAIAPVATLDSARVWRPLLPVSRKILLGYARQHDLRWIDDPHNADPRYARSWLRSRVMPLLHARWPDADAQLARAADHAADASILLEGLAVRLHAAAALQNGGLSVASLLRLTPAERRLVLRHWLAAKALPAPFAATLQQLETDVLNARADATPLLCWPGGEFRRYRDALYASAPLPALAKDFRVDWDGRQPLRLPEGYGQLQGAQAFAAPVEVCFARGGERIRPGGQAHSRSLRQLGQQFDIPPWLRPRLPLVFVNGVLVSVAGHWQSADAPKLQWQAPDLPGLPLSWQTRIPNS